MKILLGYGNVLIGVCGAVIDDNTKGIGVSLSVTGVDFGVGSRLKGRQVDPDLVIVSKSKDGLQVLRDAIDLAISGFDND